MNRLKPMIALPDGYRAAAERLAVPLHAAQITAANRLHSRLKQWVATDRALSQLHERFPGSDPEACLLKVAAVNVLYRTNVFAVMRMAEHVSNIMADVGPETASMGLVDRIAALPRVEGQRTDRKFVSFASKFARFFIDQERFPIYDSYAERMVGFHLGCQYRCKNGGRYARYVAKLDALRREASLSCSYRDLDRYLWLAGQYRQWLKDKSRREAQTTNTEARRLFSAPSDLDRVDLNAMLLLNGG